MKKFNKTVVFTFTNNKGGAGKTSISANFGRVLSLRGYKVLFVDCDMQGNLTQALGLVNNNIMETIGDKHLANAILKLDDIQDYIFETGYENIDAVVFHEKLAIITNVMFGRNYKEQQFEKMFKNVIDSNVYDFIIFDVNPALDILTFNAVFTSDYAISPIHMSAFGLRTIPVLNNFLNEISKHSNRYKGVKFFLNSFDKREKITNAKVMDVINNNFRENLLETVIPVDINVKKSQMDGVFVDELKKNSVSIVPLNELVDEMLDLIEV